MPVTPPSGFQQGRGAAGPGDGTARPTPQHPGSPDDRRPPAHGIGAVGAGRPLGTGGPMGAGTGPLGPGTGPLGPGAPGPAAPGPAGTGPFGPGAGSGDGPEHVSGDTLVSGIPVVGGTGPSPFPAAQPSGAASEARPQASSSSPSSSAGKKKGRPKLVLAGAGLFGLLAVAYGAGLLLDHADVPKGTTVLGVDIGGSTKVAAVDKLDDALSDRRSAPLTVTVDGKEGKLKPSASGLTIDTESTVRAAAGRDYNPVSVIGSLFGGSREAEPEISVDEEKLSAALKILAGDTGGDQDGTITFKPGKAIPTPGRTHQALDVGQAVAAVDKAYRERAETGTSPSVDLPVSLQKPTISRAEIDRAMKDFAQPAMSGLVTVQTDAAHKISFSPENSLPKFLGMQAINGKLVDTYDLKALEKLYGGTFEGVKVLRGNGQKTPVTPQDVAGVLRTALRGKTPDDRIGVIKVNVR
ncbi:hypothetical protein ABZW18_08470 [Streptomyces sp. NPDC004647]|uniref:hypothetical protein n=1 Tax=Streptomyces sp. NPDC004647 TaxID=3154671 RepID=UPI00339ECF3D